MPRAEKVYTKKQYDDIVDALLNRNKRIAELESWIKAANQFAWAPDCSRAVSNDPCTCGLDDFLSRPRPFIQSYKQRIAALREQLEHDRSLVADCLTTARKAVRSREWFTEGRGCYEWNDDRWHSEFAQAADEFLAALAPMERVAQDWSDCPKSSDEVAQARLNLEQRIADLESKRDALQKALDTAQHGIEDVAAQARLCLGHIGVPDHQRKWVSGEIANEEKIAIKRIERALAGKDK